RGKRKKLPQTPRQIPDAPDPGVFLSKRPTRLPPPRPFALRRPARCHAVLSPCTPPPITQYSTEGGGAAPPQFPADIPSTIGFHASGVNKTSLDKRLHALTGQFRTCTFSPDRFHSGQIEGEKVAGHFMEGQQRCKYQ